MIARKMKQSTTAMAMTNPESGKESGGFDPSGVCLGEFGLILPNGYHPTHHTNSLVITI